MEENKIEEMMNILGMAIKELDAIDIAKEEPVEEPKTEWIESFIELPEQNEIVLGYGCHNREDKAYFTVVSFSNVFGWTNDDYEPMFIDYWAHISNPEDC